MATNCPDLVDMRDDNVYPPTCVPKNIRQGDCGLCFRPCFRGFAVVWA